MQEWNYTADHGRNPSFLGCLAVFGIVLIFWILVFGAGIWLSDNLTDILEGIRT